MAGQGGGEEKQVKKNMEPKESNPHKVFPLKIRTKAMFGKYMVNPKAPVPSRAAPSIAILFVADFVEKPCFLIVLFSGFISLNILDDLNFL